MIFLLNPYRFGAGGGGSKPVVGDTLLLTLDYGTTPSASDDIALAGRDKITLLYRGIVAPGLVGVRVSTDGTNFSATSGDYLGTTFDNSKTAADSAQTMMVIAVASMTCFGFADLYGLQAGGAAFMRAIGHGTTGNPISSRLDRTKSTIVGPFTHIRIVSPSGNITAGTIEVIERDA